MSGFVHLHCHSDFSLLDGLATIDGYVNKCQELGMNAIALTDHGNMHGVINFYNACKAAGIKPIIGCEFYHTRDRKIKDPNDKYNHLILLAMDEIGYKQLLKLQAIAWIEGKYYKPRIDDEALEEYSSHLICLSACVSGELPKLILKGKPDEALERAKWFQHLFGDRFYIEVQKHDLPDENKAFPPLMDIATKLGIKIVATNDVHYIEKEDWDVHDTMLCIDTKRQKHDSNRISYKPGEYYLRSEDEMRTLFGGHEELLSNTVEVASRCNLELKLPGPILPVCPIPPEYKSDAEYLKALSYKGLNERYPDVTPEHRAELEERLEHELGIIERMKFPAYFLIVADYINWAKDHKIAVGPGRGSGAGSLVAYCCRITDVDPIRYGLIFERFLNPDRVSMPDFDVDFCFERRGEVIDYVTKHYGSDHVSQICAFSVEKAKSVFKDVAKVFGVPFSESTRIASMIPDEIPGEKAVTLKKCVEKIPEIRELAESLKYQTVFAHAIKLEGKNRHTTLHPAGVVIGRDRIDEYVPILTDSDGTVASQISSPTIEECGLVKIDFLGLKTLTVIRNTVSLIHRKDPNFDIEKVPENDKKTFDMLSRGEASCVFQFESKGMKDILKRTKPSSIDELAALNALYRPGPMQFIDQYIDSKWGRQQIQYPDPCLKELLDPTYGVIVYQEQVMKVAQIIAGYSLGEADNLRRIMGKKKVDKMAQELIKFKAGAVRNGFTEEHAEEIFHILEPFAGYGFNKSHAVAYTIIAYRTAYLKAHYPSEFMAANLTNEAGNPDKFKEYLSLASSWGLKVLPPNINTSLPAFSVQNGNEITYGLAAIRNVGLSCAKNFVKEREENGPYLNAIEFVRRQESSLGSRAFEALVKSGAMDTLNLDRAVLVAGMKDLMKYDSTVRNKKAKDEEIGQMSLFDEIEESPDYTFPQEVLDTPPMIKRERLALEREYLGVYLSGHPTDEYKEVIDSAVCVDLSDPSTFPLNTETSIVAEVASYEKKYSKKTEKEFGILKISTKEGSLELFFSSKCFDEYGSSSLLEEGNVIGIKGTFSKRKDGSLTFFIQQIVKPLALTAKSASILHVRMKEGVGKRDISNLKAILANWATNTGFSVLLSVDDDPWTEYELPFVVAPEKIDFSLLHLQAGVAKAWTE